MMTFNDALAIAANSQTMRRGVNAHTLANATRLIRKSSLQFVIRYHDTDLITIYSDGTYRLDKGGNFSPTARKRIELYTPARIVRRANAWYLKDSRGLLYFYDGMVVDQDGNQIDDPLPIACRSTR